jgi:c-di-GMP-binding flagellar brake protein YcgR
MAEVKVVEDFNFIDFLSLNDVYSKYIRTKGEAMLKITNNSIVGDDQLEIELKDDTLQQGDFVLVFKVENEIYHIQVVVEEIREKDNCSCLIRKEGKVLCLSERRSYDRVEINEKIEYYTIENRIQQFYKGIIEDISASGAKLVTKHELDAKYPVILNTSYLDLPLKELRGKIVWKEKDGNKFFYGIHFKFEDESKQEQLINGLY